MLKTEADVYISVEASRRTLVKTNYERLRRLQLEKPEADVDTVVFMQNLSFNALGDDTYDER
jgi:hypothetical protein